MTHATSSLLVLAMGQSAQSSQSLLVQLIPFALMIGIFYVLVLLPMRKRQKKVQDFQAGLKVGDRIITTNGFFGQITRLEESKLNEGKTIQVQIAEIGRASCREREEIMGGGGALKIEYSR